MYLKTLEITGFKSFAERTNIEFNEGLTVVVGPNGCGKTNIVEAILWVLGEQGLKNLRASNSLGLIFSGSKTREPSSMAEVSLIFDNTARLFPMEYDEVKVSRRLYRNGESEFLINNENVRLKDIQNLFLDTGLGVSSYSILKQGTVERIVNAKPEELRVFIDEAIGVSKFQKEKQEAERNIEKSTENLLRVTDIMEEVRKQLSSMDYQAKKAKKYKEIKEKYERLRVNFLYRLYLEVKKSKEEKQLEWEDKQNLWKELKGKLREYSNILSELKIEYEKKRDEIINREREFYVSGYEMENIKKERQSLSERLALMPQKLESVREKIDRLSEILDEKAKIKRELELKLRESENILEQKEKIWTEVEKFLKEENLNYFDEEDIEEKNNELFEIYRGLLSKENDLKSTEEKIRELSFSKDRVEEEFKKEEERIVNVKSSIDEKSEKIKSLRENLNAKQEEISKKQNSKLENLKKIREIEKRIAFQEGKSKKHSSKDVPQEVLGRVSDFVKINNISLKGFFLERFNWFVVRTKEDALRLAEEFKEKEDFYVFVPLESLEEINEEVKKYLEFLEGKEKLSSIFNLSEVMSIEEDRLIFKWGGVGTGKVKTLKEIEDELRSLREELNVRNERDVSFKEELESLIDKKNELFRDLRNMEMEKESTERELEKARVFLTTLEREKNEIEEGIKSSNKEKENLNIEIEKIKEDIERLKEEIGKMKKMKDIIKEKEREEGKSFKEIKSDLVLAREKHSAIESRIKGIRNEVEVLNERLKDLRLEEAALKEEEEFLSERLRELGEKIEGYIKDKGSMEEELRDIKEELSKIELDIKEKEEERKKIELELEKEEEIRRAIYGELSKFDSEIESINKRLNDMNYSIEKAELIYNPQLEVNEEILENMNNKLMRLGNVNLSAPEEYERLKKRFDFLKAQKDDLEKAIEDSKKLILKINSEIKERFLKHYEGIRENFKKIFVRLFEGGEGDLILTNEEDILSTGIDIKVNPPGKKVMSKAQLSGGESALSSIAFLFSFFMLRPSPICVLDEADAPLDDANVLRFIKLIKEFSKNIQFLVITHNKRTMEASDVIYGITMEELGVSKVLSVNLRKVEKSLVV